jgi:hypothetical protein
LLADLPVSVCNSELAPITIAPKKNKVWEVTAGGKLTLPLVHSRRCEFSGTNISLKTWGPGIGTVPVFDAPLNADASQVVLDLAKMKTAPGDYVIAFYGSAVAKYRYNLEAVKAAEKALQQAQQAEKQLTAEVRLLTETARTAPDDQKGEVDQAARVAAEKQKSAAATVVAANQRLKAATAKSQPKDIVDIIVSTPIRIRVKPAP